MQTPNDTQQFLHQLKKLIKDKVKANFSQLNCKGIEGKRGLAPFILKVGIRWKREVNFTLRRLYPREMPLNPSSHWKGEWVGNRARVNVSTDILKKKNESEINYRHNELGSTQTSSYMQPFLLYYFKAFFSFRKCMLQLILLVPAADYNW